MSRVYHMLKLDGVYTDPAGDPRLCWITTHPDNADMVMMQVEPCPRCDGTGKVLNGVTMQGPNLLPCGASGCKGKGWVLK